MKIELNSIVITMICEKCKGEHEGSYGSGRFCSKFCASAFSTQEKRLIINEIVRYKIKERGSAGFIHLNSGEVRAKREATMIARYGTKGFPKDSGANAIRLKHQLIYEKGNFLEMSENQRRRKLLEECNGYCTNCNVNEWRGQTLTLEMDHIDGNVRNNSKENLRMLCPNCHSLTPTFRKPKRLLNTNVD